MPYRKRYYKKKRYYKRRRRSNYSRMGSALSLASKGLAVAYGVKRLMNVEFKFHQVEKNATAIPNTGDIVELTNIDQGDTAQTRDGAQIKCMSISCKYTITINSSAVNSFVRVILVRDIQTNQAIYSLSDLLENSGALAIESHLNLDNKYRFQVLANRVHKLSNTTGTDLISGHIFKRVGTKIRYDNTGNGIADLTSKSFSIVFISDEAVNTPTLKMVARIRYVDN